MSTIPPPIEPRVCIVCGVSFIPKSYSGKMCSDECRKNRHRFKVKPGLFADGMVVPDGGRVPDFGLGF